jgi:hypothetical protein
MITLRLKTDDKLIDHEWYFNNEDELKQFFVSLQMFHLIFENDQASYTQLVEHYLRPMMSRVKAGAFTMRRSK